jgi:hypothetical protein
MKEASLHFGPALRSRRSCCAHRPGAPEHTLIDGLGRHGLPKVRAGQLQLAEERSVLCRYITEIRLF